MGELVALDEMARCAPKRKYRCQMRGCDNLATETMATQGDLGASAIGQTGGIGELKGKSNFGSGKVQGWTLYETCYECRDILMVKGIATHLGDVGKARLARLRNELLAK